MLAWSPKDPQEVITIGFEVADNLDSTETLQSATAEATVVTGTDATPSAILFGAPEIDGTIVRHAVHGGLDAVRYRIAFTIDTSLGNRYVEVGVIDVAQKD